MPPIIDEAEELLRDRGVRVPGEKLLTLALTALSGRALVWASALGAGAVWGFATWHPEPLRLVAATGYCLCVLVPVLWRDSKGA